jgi:hypothetical protein
MFVKVKCRTRVVYALLDLYRSLGYEFHQIAMIRSSAQDEKSSIQVRRRTRSSDGRRHEQ